MIIETEEQAATILDDRHQDARLREAALRYLSNSVTPAIIKRLVLALQDDDFGVRWEAAVSLTELGDAALPDLLNALVDPQRVGDPRLREGIYHILHHNSGSQTRAAAWLLMPALKGTAADITALQAASQVLLQLEMKRRARLRSAVQMPASSLEKSRIARDARLKAFSHHWGKHT